MPSSKVTSTSTGPGSPPGVTNVSVSVSSPTFEVDLRAVDRHLLGGVHLGALDGDLRAALGRTGVGLQRVGGGSVGVTVTRTVTFIALGQADLVPGSALVLGAVTLVAGRLLALIRCAALGGTLGRALTRGLGEHDLTDVDLSDLLVGEHRTHVHVHHEGGSVRIIRTRPLDLVQGHGRFRADDLLDAKVDRHGRVDRKIRVRVDRLVQQAEVRHLSIGAGGALDRADRVGRERLDVHDPRPSRPGGPAARPATQRKDGRRRAAGARSGRTRSCPRSTRSTTREKRLAGPEAQRNGRVRPRGGPHGGRRCPCARPPARR